MSDENTGTGIDTQSWTDPGKKNAQLIYILYFAGFLFGGIPTIVGLVMAYMNRGKAAGELVDSHYTWLIRTFWISLAYTLISFLLMFLIIGILTMIAAAIWMIIRLVKGVQKLGRDEPVADTQTWWI